ncbi:MAG: Zn-ribbon domain-containing OB-fold protein [Chloroflexota bacterium]
MESRPFSDTSYQQFLNEEKLMGSKCQKCGALYAPPRSICPKCYGTAMGWVELKGKGKLAAFTSITVGTPAMVKEGYDRKHPYISAAVELDEGPRVMARLEDVDGTKPEAIKVGTPLKVKYLHHGEGENQKTFLGFTPE